MQVRAIDAVGNVSDLTEPIVVTTAGGAGTTVNTSVAASLDDAYEYVSGGIMDITSATLSAGDAHYIGLRFTLNVPQGAAISSADIDFTAAASTGAQTINFAIEDTDDASAFSENNTDISSRTTTGSVDWVISADWSDDEVVTTADLSDLIEAVTNKASWQSGNSIVIIGLGNSANTRLIKSFESGSAPTLNVTYTGGNQGNDSEAPSVPQNLTDEGIDLSTVSLIWNASTDNIEVTEYEVFNGEVSLGTTMDTTFEVTGLNAGATYTFKVTAKDAVGNTSAKSAGHTVSTTSLAATEGMYY